MRSNNNNKLKAFVRFDGSGRIISSSLIVQAFKPKVGNWQEIDAKECCNYTTTTTSTTISLICNSYSISSDVGTYFAEWIDCFGIPQSSLILQGLEIYDLCARVGTLVYEGDIVDNGLCPV